MQNNQGFANLIYEYFVVRFHFQYYKYGDSLPTIDTLCSEFSVSSLTIKSAYKRLQDEGYISRSHGRCAKVIFQQSGLEMKTYAVRFFQERRSTFSDLNQSSALIIMPMLVKGFRLMDDSGFEYLEWLSGQPNPEDQIRFYSYILQKTQNPLALNLFWEAALFFGLPFPMQYEGHTLYDGEEGRKRLQDLIACGKSGNRDLIYQAHHAFQRDVSEKILNYIQKRIPPAAQDSGKGFTWNIYRDRPQICCRLAGRVMHDVCQGGYRSMDFLPPYEKMAEKYNVSVSTMRRTVHLLNQLGFTQSINGKGIRILFMCDCGDEEDIDLTHPVIRQNIAYFIQSFELLAESCREVIHITLESLSGKEKDELTDMLEDSLSTGLYILSSQSIFTFTAEHSPLQGIREIYGKLYSLNLWGYPLKKFRKRMPDFDSAIRAFTENFLYALRENDMDKCSETISSFMKKEYKTTFAVLLENGFKPEELHTSPCFSFMRAETKPYAPT